MRSISYKRHRFPADVIRQAVWLYFRFTMSFRDVEDLLAQRGIEVSYQTIRCWTIKFGPAFASNLKGVVRLKPQLSELGSFAAEKRTIGAKHVLILLTNFSVVERIFISKAQF